MCAGAQGANAAAGASQSGGSWWILLIYAALFAAIYFFFIRPSSKKKKEEANMRNNIQIGDQITTIGGIVGKVVAVKEDEESFVIETGSDRVKMKFKKWAVSSVDNQKEEDTKTAKMSFREARAKAKEEKAKAKEEKAKEKENK